MITYKTWYRGSCLFNTFLIQKTFFSIQDFVLIDNTSNFMKFIKRFEEIAKHEVLQIVTKLKQKKKIDKNRLLLYFLCKRNFFALNKKKRKRN